jgi:hypothetical protein
MSAPVFCLHLIIKPRLNLPEELLHVAMAVPNGHQRRAQRRFLVTIGTARATSSAGRPEDNYQCQCAEQNLQRVARMAWP